jgi:hypothetical protein
VNSVYSGDTWLRIHGFSSSFYFSVPLPLRLKAPCLPFCLGFWASCNDDDDADGKVRMERVTLGGDTDAIE